MRDENKICEYVKDGKRCQAYKMIGSKHCVGHSKDPEVVSMRERALIKVAESRKLYLPAEEGTEVSLNFPKFVKLDTAKGIRKAYITILQAAARGLIAEKRLGALTYALNGFVAAQDKLLLMERIEKLEKIAKQRGG